MDRDRPQRPVETTESSFEILERVKDEDGLSLQELDERLDLSRSTIHRHLTTLEELGAITREDGKYDIGLRFLDFGFYAREKHRLYTASREHTKRLANETNETVWLMTEENGFSVYLDKVEGDNQFQSFSAIGGRHPMHMLSGGKAMLAHYPRKAVEAIIDRHGLKSNTDHTITTRDELFDELAQIRERGYAINRQESIRGIHAIGAPIFHDDDVVGAVSISGAAQRFKEEAIHGTLLDQLLATANEIEVTLRFG